MLLPSPGPEFWPVDVLLSPTSRVVFVLHPQSASVSPAAPPSFVVHPLFPLSSSVTGHGFCLSFPMSFPSPPVSRRPGRGPSCRVPARGGSARPVRASRSAQRSSRCDRLALRLRQRLSAAAGARPPALSFCSPCSTVGFLRLARTPLPSLAPGLQRSLSRSALHSLWRKPSSRKAALNPVRPALSPSEASWGSGSVLSLRGDGVCAGGRFTLYSRSLFSSFKKYHAL